MPITRRALLAAPFAAPLAVTAAGGAQATALAPQAAAAPSQPEALTFGALFPLSGSLSLLGDESFRGVDLAVDEVNAQGGLFGRQIALARGDATDAEAAASEAKRLIEQVKVPLIFGSFSSVVSFAASAVAEVAAVPYIELDALADPITERGFKLLFRTGPEASACGALAVDTVADLLAPLWQVDPGALKLALLFEDGLAGAALAAAQQKRCRERGLQLAEQIGYAASGLDLTPQALRLHGAAIDVVLHTGLLNDVVAFHRAMKQAGWRPRMVVGTGGGYALNDTAQALGADFDGALSVGVAPYRISDIVAPGAGGVAAAYQRKFGAPPRSGHSLSGFSGARVAFAAIRKAGTLAHDALRAALLATDDPPRSTVGGSGVRFDAQGQNTRAMPYVAQWQRGALVTVAPDVASVAGLRPGMGP